MKKFIVLILAMAFLLTSNTIFAAQQDINTYFRASLGAVIATDGKMKITKPVNMDLADITTKPGFIFSGAFGFQSKQLNWFRGEIEISYQKYDLDKMTNIAGGEPDKSFNNNSMSSLAFMGNAYVDLHNNSQITPYIMFGLGGSFNNVGTSSNKDNWTTFSYQAGLGIGYALDRQLTFDLGYRYFKTGNTTETVIIDGTSCDLEYNPGGTNSFMAGFRFAF